jgi:tetratricopeptide (TPR) repeat protein
VDNGNSLTISAVTSAYFILLKCYIDAGKKEKVVPILQKFTHEIDTNVQNAESDKQSDWLGYALLGYIHQSLQQYDKAIICYTKAKSLKKVEYSLAQRNIEQCQQLLIAKLVANTNKTKVNDAIAAVSNNHLDQPCTGGDVLTPPIKPSAKSQAELANQFSSILSKNSAFNGKANFNTCF